MGTEVPLDITRFQGTNASNSQKFSLGRLIDNSRGGFGSLVEGVSSNGLWVAFATHLIVVNINAELFEHLLGSLQSEVGTLHVRLQICNFRGTGDGENIFTLRVHPGQGHLCRSDSSLGSSSLQGSQQSSIAFEVLTTQVGTEVLKALSSCIVSDLTPVLTFLHQSRREASAERRVGDNADAQLPTCWHKLFLQASDDHGPFLLNRCQGMDRVSESYFRRCSLREADVLDFALGH
mmetsp:Transcript_14631/g.22250  ORF Transcript_14631/g.22250 Transcript_14631/m.22250 type:complete len:235 (-) Transcript_14631:222-926(-)